MNGVYDPPKPPPTPTVSNRFMEMNGVYTPPAPAPRPPSNPVPLPALTGAGHSAQDNALNNTLGGLAQTVGVPPILSADNPIQNPPGTGTPPPPPPDPRFNDVVDPETEIHGWDLSTSDESDALFGYAGRDGGGAWTAGTGLVDFQNNDPDHWLQGFEILTAEARLNLTDPNADFIGLDVDAQVTEWEFNAAGQRLNVGYLTANGTIGGDADGMGVMLGANIVDFSYQNGAPSADNDRDLNAGFSLSAGPNLGGFLLHANDPDQDGVLNFGADVAVGPVGVHVSSETAGAAIQAEAQNVSNAYYNGLFGTDLPVDDRNLFERGRDAVVDAFDFGIFPRG